jgi:phosphoribosylanthranilate isomerase
MLRVKICGLRIGREIEAVNGVRPDYAGFVFAPSRRKVTPDEAARLIERLKPEILPVGVFVNERTDIIVNTVRTCGLKVVQLHGEEDLVTIEMLREALGAKVELWKALKLSYDGAKAQHADQNFMGLCDRLIYDGALPGSGRLVNLAHLPPSLDRSMLAGGLSPENVGEILKKVRPFGVDVSSGVEGRDGFKDPERMERFVQIVREKEDEP